MGAGGGARANEPEQLTIQGAAGGDKNPLTRRDRDREPGRDTGGGGRWMRHEERCGGGREDDSDNTDTGHTHTYTERARKGQRQIQTQRHRALGACACSAVPPPHLSLR